MDHLEAIRNGDTKTIAQAENALKRGALSIQERNRIASAVADALMSVQSPGRDKMLLTIGLSTVEGLAPSDSIAYEKAYTLLFYLFYPASYAYSQPRWDAMISLGLALKKHETGREGLKSLTVKTVEKTLLYVAGLAEANIRETAVELLGYYSSDIDTAAGLRKLLNMNTSKGMAKRIEAAVSSISARVVSEEMRRTLGSERLPFRFPRPLPSAGRAKPETLPRPKVIISM